MDANSSSAFHGDGKIAVIRSLRTIAIIIIIIANILAFINVCYAKTLNILFI